MILDDPAIAEEPIDAAAFAAATGWAIEPRGACRGPVCVPLGGAETFGAVVERLGMPIVADRAHGVAALGPATVGGRALVSVEAPDLELPLVLADGVWRLADQRGRRTVMIAWAPW